jgi:uncharacterized protein YeaC (DUF1315 family)
MSIEQLLATMTPEVYQSLKRAVELGKWPTGDRLSQEQRETCMQAVVAYEHLNLSPDQHTGFIPPEPHTYCGGDDHHHEDDKHEDKPITWVE